VKLTGSKMSLFQKCQWWARPDVIVKDRPLSSSEANLGKAVHAAIETHILGSGTAETFGADAEVVNRMLWAWQDSQWSGIKWEPEVAFAYDPATGSARTLGRGREAYVNAGPTEITGTVDAIYQDGTQITIADWKTGRQSGLQSAEENAQLRFYALCAARAYGAESVRVLVVRVGEGGTQHSEAVLDDFDLAAFEDEFRARLKTIPQARPQNGHHCTYCPAVSVCPATAIAEETLVPTEPRPIGIQGPQHASWLLHRLRAIEARCEEMREILKQYVDTVGPIPLEDGKVWTKGEQVRESIALDTPEMASALKILEDHQVIGAVETKRSVSKADIERMLRDQGKKGKELKSAIESIYGDLRATGVIRSKTVTVYADRDVK
jgi:hypothetical protein